jgi:succinate dehydrogenase / fumarate reductase iron-sulfur subunit
MVLQHDAELFGSCSQHGECEVACPKQISINFIARMNADFIKAAITAESDLKQREGQ